MDAQSASAARGPLGPIQDLRVRAVIERMRASARRPEDGGPHSHPDLDPAVYADYGFSIYPDQGDLIYLLCRAMRVVEFATSVGMSTLYFAAAVRDNGGGLVIGSELAPAKVDVARRNLAAAGLDDYVMNDNAEPDFLDFIRDPANGFISITLPLKGGTELSVKVG